MAKNNFIGYLLNPKNWWLPLLLIFNIPVAAGIVKLLAQNFFCNNQALSILNHEKN